MTAYGNVYKPMPTQLAESPVMVVFGEIIGKIAVFHTEVGTTGRKDAIVFRAIMQQGVVAEEVVIVKIYAIFAVGLPRRQKIDEPIMVPTGKHIESDVVYTGPQQPQSHPMMIVGDVVLISAGRKS